MKSQLSPQIAFPEHLETLLQVQESSTISAEVVLGNLWPPHVYVREKKRQIPKGKVQTVIISGTTYKGIVLPPSEGEPVGCVKLRSTDSQTIVKTKNALPEWIPKSVGSSQLNDIW